MEKRLWFATFLRTEIPAFGCPKCQAPKLALLKGSLKTKETAYSKAAQKDDNWEPDWIKERFVMILECSVPSCGELVAVSGSIEVEPNPTEDGRWQYEGFLCPKSMSPAPRIITIPSDTPLQVQRELELAFQLYWADSSSCATKIRTSVERLMDHFKVVKTYVAKNPKKPNEAGKQRPLDLAARIDKFISATGEAVHKDLLHALRVIGNVGTHKEERPGSHKIPLGGKTKMAYSLYDAAVTPCAQQLGALAGIIDKAAAH